MTKADASIRQPVREELIKIRVMRRREMMGEETPPTDLKTDPIDLLGSTINVAAFSDSGEVISTVRLKPISDKKQIYEVSRMVTHAAYRGQGIGAKVLAVAESLAIQRNATGFVLNARAKARSFYARAGYWPTGREKTLDNGDINYIMVKQIENEK